MKIPKGVQIMKGDRISSEYRINPLPVEVREGVLHQIFNRFDLDGDGELLLPELVNLRRAVTLEKGAWAFGRNAKILSNMDLDGDGGVEAEEFVNYFIKSMPQPLEAFENSAISFMEAAEKSQSDGPASDDEILKIRLHFSEKDQKGKPNTEEKSKTNAFDLLKGSPRGRQKIKISSLTPIPKSKEGVSMGIRAVQQSERSQSPRGAELQEVGSRTSASLERQQERYVERQEKKVKSKNLYSDLGRSLEMLSRELE